MDDKNKRIFTIATCIVAYSVILINIVEFSTEYLAMSIFYHMSQIAALVIIAFIFVKTVESKVVEVDKGDEDDE